MWCMEIGQNLSELIKYIFGVLGTLTALWILSKTLL